MCCGCGFANQRELESISDGRRSTRGIHTMSMCSPLFFTVGFEVCCRSLRMVRQRMTAEQAGAAGVRL